MLYWTIQIYNISWDWDLRKFNVRQHRYKDHNQQKRKREVLCGLKIENCYWKTSNYYTSLPLIMFISLLF